jgi:2-keto-3-deoxy-L-rhamnonate aldolase RhmA
MTDKPNSLKHALRGSEVSFALWCSLASALTTEITGDAGADWLLLDCEHAPNDLPRVIEKLRALATFNLEPLVRLPCDDRVLIKQYLDAGAAA